MGDLISRLSELRCQYSCFDENERDTYHTLSDAIEALKEHKTGKWIYSYTDMICPVCNASFDDEIIYMCENGKMNFCPNCGCRMEREEE